MCNCFQALRLCNVSSAALCRDIQGCPVWSGMPILHTTCHMITHIRDTEIINSVSVHGCAAYGSKPCSLRIVAWVSLPSLQTTQEEQKCCDHLALHEAQDVKKGFLRRPVSQQKWLWQLFGQHPELSLTDKTEFKSKSGRRSTFN